MVMTSQLLFFMCDGNENRIFAKQTLDLDEMMPYLVRNPGKESQRMGSIEECLPSMCACNEGIYYQLEGAVEHHNIIREGGQG